MSKSTKSSYDKLGAPKLKCPLCGGNVVVTGQSSGWSKQLEYKAMCMRAECHYRVGMFYTEARCIDVHLALCDAVEDNTSNKIEMFKVDIGNFLDKASSMWLEDKDKYSAKDVIKGFLEIVADNFGEKESKKIEVVKEVKSGKD
ncbi:hypothetical protein M0R04_05495 [Candidatus Dojkabacteria bacterium]|jgi:hypothetical protein|nr:hypothetical protein [Candidatus Dojkabacteria bacterium]